MSGSRKVVALNGDEVEHLPWRCTACLFWELGRPRPDPGVEADDELAGDPQVAKQAWCTHQTLAGRAPGRIVRIHDEVAAYALFAPSAQFAPRKLPVPGASDDALLLATAWVEPAYRTAGIGRLLIQAAVKEALRLELTAVEAYGDRRYRESDCVLPCTWLLHEGFEIATEHPRYPLLRLECGRTVRWTEAIEHAVEEVLDRLPHRTPAPDTGVRMPVPETRRGRASPPSSPSVHADAAPRSTVADCERHRVTGKDVGRGE